MKKFIALLLSVMLMLTFAACGSDADTDNKNGDNAPKEDGYSFTYNSTKIEFGAEASDILNALGEPKSYTEETSCAFDGLDKTYFYGSFYLTTYPDGDKDYIYSAWFIDDSITTDEGIYIGAVKGDVEAKYGEGCFNGEKSCTLTKGNTKLVFILNEEDVVISIQYEAIVE